MRDDEFKRSWAHFQNRLRKTFGEGLCGLRVFERHFGGGARHGTLHCHCVLSHRIPVRVVRRLARGTGMGRMQVVACGEGSAEYLCKYLGKDIGLGSGLRRWARLGGWDAVKVGDIVDESATARLFRALLGRRIGSPGAFKQAKADFEVLTRGRGRGERAAILEDLEKNGFPSVNSYGELNPF